MEGSPHASKEVSDPSSNHHHLHKENQQHNIDFSKRQHEAGKTHRKNKVGGKFPRKSSERVSVFVVLRFGSGKLIKWGVVRLLGPLGFYRVCRTTVTVCSHCRLTETPLPPLPFSLFIYLFLIIDTFCWQTIVVYGNTQESYGFGNPQWTENHAKLLSVIFFLCYYANIDN